MISRRGLLAGVAGAAAFGTLAACGKKETPGSSGNKTITLGFSQVGSESGWRSANTTSVKDAAALGYVREFMTSYTTLDPFHANDYADRILAQGTGDFAKMFKEKESEILIQVARAEPTTGIVLEAGVQRWNDNGSADVLVATKVSTKSPDGKSMIESGNRWVATAIREGQQWKISQLIQVI